VKYAFIRDELVGTCTTRMACRLLEVSPSGYYQFLQALPAPRKDMEALHRESRGAHPHGVASNLRLTKDHARASETWSRRSSQHGLTNHARVRNPSETCTKVPSNNYAECARTCTFARAS
jgi:hypothetical protein